jgi:hypothetical protein
MRSNTCPFPVEAVKEGGKSSLETLVLKDYVLRRTGPVALSLWTGCVLVSEHWHKPEGQIFASTLRVTLATLSGT